MLNVSSFRPPATVAIAIAFTVIAAAGTTFYVMNEQAPPAYRLCYAQETGVWRNDSARPGDISVIQVETRCENNRLVHRTRTFTKCAPRDCSWGWTPGVRGTNGRFSAYYTTYSAHRLVDLRVNDQLMEAHVHNDFHDARKGEETSRFTLIRAD